MPLVKCPDCGSMISAQAPHCPRCNRPMNGPSSSFTGGASPQPNYPQQTYGQSQPQPFQPLSQPQPFQSANPSSGAVDAPSVGLNIVSFLFPLAGWILYFVFRENTPVKAKSCSKWAWIGVAVNFIAYFILGTA